MHRPPLARARSIYRSPASRTRLQSFVGAKGYVYRRLDGITSHKDRQARIKEFNSDRHAVFVFLISTRGKPTAKKRVGNVPQLVSVKPSTSHPAERGTVCAVTLSFASVLCRGQSRRSSRLGVSSLPHPTCSAAHRLVVISPGTFGSACVLR